VAYLHHADYSGNDFVDRLKSIVYPDEKIWAWIENPDQWKFGFLEDVVLEESERGRVFSESGELKWRRLKDNIWRVVFLGTNQWTGVQNMQDASHLLQDLEVKTEDQILWGEFKPHIKKWVELRIPHKFNYPVEKGPNVCLTVEVWRSKKDGHVHFQRYYGLKPVEEE